MLTQGAIMSITCNIRQSYTLQILGICRLSQKQSRIFISDGTTYLCADIETEKAIQLTSYSVLRMMLSFQGISVPLQVQKMEVILKDCDHVIGNPIPFAEFVKNGYQTQKNKLIESENCQETQQQSQNRSTSQMPHKNALDIQVQTLQKQSQSTIQKNNVSIEKQGEESESITIPQRQGICVLDKYVPIQMLYQSLRGWKILARVIWMDFKEISKDRSKCQRDVEVLNFVIVDYQSNRAECSAFGKASEKWKSVIKKGSIYQFSNGKVLSMNNKSTPMIRFQCESVISSISQQQSQLVKIPKNFFKPIPFNQIINQIQINNDFDVSGIVKQIFLKQNVQRSNKTKMKLVLADPIAAKQIEVSIIFPNEALQKIKVNMILVLTNVKGVKNGSGSISLKSGFKSDLIISFTGDQQNLKQLFPFEGTNFADIELVSLSQTSYKIRTLKRHIETLQLAAYDQRIYSRINLRFLGLSNTLNKVFYQACVRCLKKIANTSGRRSNYCQGYGCRKIVETKKEYCLKAIFGDWNDTIVLTLFRNAAVSLLGIDANQFARMPELDQNKYINSIRFKQVSVCMFSNKKQYQFIHEVESMMQPHKDQSSLIHELIDSYRPFQLKKEYDD